MAPDFDSFLQWILDLREEINIPNDLSQIGIDDARLDEIGEMAVADPTAATNPVPAGPEEMLSIYRAAYEGRLS